MTRAMIAIEQLSNVLSTMHSGAIMNQQLHGTLVLRLLVGKSQVHVSNK